MVIVLNEQSTNAYMLKMALIRAKQFCSEQRYYSRSLQPTIGNDQKQQLIDADFLELIPLVIKV